MKPRHPNDDHFDPQMTQMNADGGKRQNDLRKSASSADCSPPISPREIEVHIEELVLHGFDPRSRWTIGDALENELGGLLSTKGLPVQWQNSPTKLDAGSVRLTNPSGIGKEIAAAIHRGGGR
jgi:hypothetical protein